LDSASPKKKTALQLYLFTWWNFENLKKKMSVFQTMHPGGPHAK